MRLTTMSENIPDLDAADIDQAIIDDFTIATPETVETGDLPVKDLQNGADQ